MSRKGFIVPPILIAILALVIAVGGVGLAAWRTKYLDKWLPPNIKEMFGRGEKPEEEPEEKPEEKAKGKIAFVRNGDIWVINKDGTEEKRITSDGLNKLPKWSPDGKYLSWIHLAEVPSGTYTTVEETAEEIEVKEKRGTDIHLKNLQTGSIEELLIPIPEEQLKGRKGYYNALRSYDWSPDSQKIVYAANGVWTKDLDSKQKSRIVDDHYDPSNVLSGWDYSSVLYSPTGKKILLTKSMYEGYGLEVFSVAASKRTKLNTQGIIFNSWGPKGVALLGGGRCGMFAGGVHLYDLGNNKIKALLKDEADGIAWSQTSGLIAIAKGFGSSGEFYQGPCQSTEFDIFTMDRAGQNLKRLTFDKKPKRIAEWSPDGNWMLYVLNPEQTPLGAGELWVVDKEGTVNFKLTANASQPAWSPK